METIVIKTGFSAIDIVTGGLKSSEMIVIAGQGRTGKQGKGGDPEEEEGGRGEDRQCLKLRRPEAP